jgi:hypothetical protein
MRRGTDLQRDWKNGGRDQHHSPCLSGHEKEHPRNIEKGSDGNGFQNFREVGI